MSLERGFEQIDGVADRYTEEMIRTRLLPEYRRSRDVIRDQMESFWVKHAVDGKLPFAESLRYDRLKGLEEGIAKEMRRLGDKSTRITETIIAGVYMLSFYRSAFVFEREVRARLGFTVLGEAQIRAAVTSPFGWPESMRLQMATATRQIRQEIVQGLIQGRPYPAIARDVSERLNMSAGRAQRIVRTEAHRAREIGKLESIEKAAKKGIDMLKVWSATAGENTRTSHALLDGKTADVFDKNGQPGRFRSVSGATAERPGGFGVAAEDINCRCSVSPLVKGYGPQIRQVKYSDERHKATVKKRQEAENAAAAKAGREPEKITPHEVVPYKTYGEYAKSRGWPEIYKGPVPRV